MQNHLPGFRCYQCQVRAKVQWINDQEPRVVCPNCGLNMIITANAFENAFPKQANSFDEVVFQGIRSATRKALGISEASDQDFTDVNDFLCGFQIIVAPIDNPSP